MLNKVELEGFLPSFIKVFKFVYKCFSFSLYKKNNLQNVIVTVMVNASCLVSVLTFVL